MDESQNETAEAEDVEEAEVLESEAFLDREIPAEELDVPLSIQPGDQTDASQDTSLVPYDPLQRYLAEVRKYPFLSKEEELQLFHEYQTTGNREAAVKLILANLRVSVAIAAEYLHSGADYMDLIQEGNVGLLQAIRKFDPTKGVRFHSYAAWWVRAYVLRYLLNTYRMVKIGTTQDQRKLFYNLNKEKRKLEREGFVPDTKLLADRLNVRERDIVEMGQRLGSWDISLDAPIGPDQEGTLMEILPAAGTPADEALADEELKKLFRQKLAEFAATLDDRYADILRNRILSETPMTLDDIGKKYNISRERARQLEDKIIKRLREHMKKEIKDFELLKP
ncbi:MAG: sigma-70 family RNA polymerase sigma factor [Nitrospirae bacterium]|nr:MAG: sigma-70 family RNA polymerase sigma factor [Nitrospirota bacterium]